MGLAEYNRKRNFKITSEPSGDAPAKPRADGALSFVIQKHAATRLHYDFRLELDGVLLSWSVPKGPSVDPAVKRLAMHVEDHPLAYGDFEGIIPKGQYGGGTVLLWDHGTWTPQEDPVKGYAAGNLKFILKGEKLSGGFALIRLGGRRGREQGEKAWLLIKEKDAHARPGGPELTDTQQDSATTGRTMEEIAADRTRVWHSKPSHVDITDVPGARNTPLPAKPKPPRVAARAKPPDGDDWLHEMEIPGVRVLARNERSAIKLFSDKGTALPAKAASKDRPIGDAVRMLPAETLLVDGIVAPLGLPTDDSKLGYFLFDIAYLDGRDLTRVPLAQRKALLEELVRRAGPGPIRFVEHIAGGGADFHREACRLGIPGMISRRAGSHYDARAGWLKIACKQTKPRRRQAPRSPRDPPRLAGPNPRPPPPRCPPTSASPTPSACCGPTSIASPRPTSRTTTTPSRTPRSRTSSTGRCRCFAARRGCPPIPRRRPPASS